MQEAQQPQCLQVLMESAKTHLGSSGRESQVVNVKHTVHTETITELFLERADPAMLKTFLLELIPFRLIPVIGTARSGKPENYWK